MWAGNSPLPPPNNTPANSHHHPFQVPHSINRTAATNTEKMTTREDYTYLAKLSEHAERYDEMVGFMKACVEQSKELTVEERNLLSVAYKNVVGARRASWRIVASIEQREESKGNSQQVGLIREYRQKIEAELKDICNDILNVLDTYLIPSAKTGEYKVFYYKLQGDYYRYLAEVTLNQERDDAAQKSLKAYEVASEIAQNELTPTHSLRIGLALNFSVFHYEILQNPEKACKIAKDAFDQAILKVEVLSDESFKDSILIMNLLKDNLTLWTGDMQDSAAQNQLEQAPKEEAQPEAPAASAAAAAAQPQQE